jgi:hypothetical protein
MGKKLAIAFRRREFDGLRGIGLRKNKELGSPLALLIRSGLRGRGGVLFEEDFMGAFGESLGLRVSAVGRDLVVQISNRDEDDIGLGGVACA